MDQFKYGSDDADLGSDRDCLVLGSKTDEGFLLSIGANQGID